jgi:hypothetical protein
MFPIWGTLSENFELLFYLLNTYFLSAVGVAIFFFDTMVLIGSVNNLDIKIPHVIDQLETVANQYR